MPNHWPSGLNESEAMTPEPVGIWRDIVRMIRPVATCHTSNDTLSADGGENPVNTRSMWYRSEAVASNVPSLLKAKSEYIERYGVVIAKVSDSWETRSVRTGPLPARSEE